MCGGGFAGRVRSFRGYVEGGVCMHVCEVAAGLCWPFRLAQICVRPTDCGMVALEVRVRVARMACVACSGARGAVCSVPAEGVARHDAAKR